MAERKNNPRYLRIYSLPRSGTNLFAAMLHNHPNIFSINSGGGSKKTVYGWEYARRHSIYPYADLYKKEKDVDYWLLDELKLHGYRGEGRFISLRDKVFLSQSFVNIRNPFGVLASMHKFHTKYSHPDWELTENNIIKFFEKYKIYLRLARCGLVTPIYFDVFVNNLEYYYMLICDRLGIDYSKTYTSFQNTFEKLGCRCGNSFEKGESQLIIGGFFKRNNIILEKPNETFYCSKCDKHVLGFGGFNPHQNIDVKRMLNWKEELDADSIDRIDNIMHEYLDEVAIEIFRSSDLSMKSADKLFYGR